MLLLFSALAPPCDPQHPVLLNSPSMPSLKRGKGGIGVGELFFVEGNGNNNGANQAAQHRYKLAIAMERHVVCQMLPQL